MDILEDVKQGVVIIGFGSLFIIMLFLLIMNMVQLRKARTRYNQMINGGNPNNVEDILIGLQTSINQLSEENKAKQTEINQMRQYMRRMKSHLGVQRYNAFSQEGGSDLSFSIAILDEEQDGVVLTGIHGREQTFIYAKPIDKGQSTYSLSPEEKVLIDQIAVKLNA